MDEIQVFKALEGVRRRPGMYVGDIEDGSGLRNLIWEVVGNVIDLHLARMATELHVEIGADSWVTVSDDGPGIPVEPAGPDAIPLLEAICTRLHVGGTYDGHYPHVHVTPFGDGQQMPIAYGLAVVNALSTRLDVETTRGGVRWAQTFERGDRRTELRQLGPTTIEGTTIRFQRDPEIFGSIVIDVQQVRERLHQLAWLHPLLRVWFQGERLVARGGLPAWACQLASQRASIDGTFGVHGTHDGVFVDLALAWAGSADPLIRSFVNTQETRSGTHVDGIWRGLVSLAHEMGASACEPDRVRSAMSPGLVAVVHVGLHAPRFGGPTRAHLTSPAAADAVARVVACELPAAVGRDMQLRRLLESRLGVAWPPTP
jgi:DNA gyrase subunit B